MCAKGILSPMLIKRVPGRVGGARRGEEETPAWDSVSISGGKTPAVEGLRVG